MKVFSWENNVQIIYFWKGVKVRWICSPPSFRMVGKLQLTNKGWLGFGSIKPWNDFKIGKDGRRLREEKERNDIKRHC